MLVSSHLIFIIFYSQKLYLEISKILKLVLVATHVMFIRFSIQNCVFKSRKLWNKYWYQATSCLWGSASKIVSWNQKSPEISAGIKPHHVYQVKPPKMCIQIKKILKYVLVSSHIMFVMFTNKNWVLKSTKSWNSSWNHATSCLSGAASKIVSWNQQTPQISAGIKPCHVYHLYNQKVCLEINKVLKLVLVSSHIMVIKLSIENCVFISIMSWI